MQLRMNSAPTDNLAFQERLQKCVQLAGGNKNKLAKLSGVPLNTLLRYFSGSEPSRDKLAQIARAANVSVGWLTAGEQITGAAEFPLQGQVETPNYGEGYVQAPWIDGSIRDANGKRQLIYAEKRAWLPLEFISDGLKGGSAHHLAAFRMKGNEMEPDLLDGEVLMVDTSNRDVREGMLAVRIKKEITARDVIQLSSDTYAFRHMQTPPSHEGIRFSADQLGLDVDILGRIIVAFRYPFRGRHGQKSAG